MNTISVVASISRKAGGLQHSVRRLHQTLNELPEIKVSVAALMDEYSERDVSQWLPLPVSLARVVGPEAFGYAPGFVLKLMEANADIMHSHGIWQYPSVAVSRWHKRTGRPYLISPHGMLDPWAVRNSAWKKKIALAFYERRHLEDAACIRALCESEARSIREFGLRNPICIIPNAMDLPKVRNSSLKTQNPPWNGVFAGRKVLLYLGRIHPKKGLANLVKAWAKNPKSNEWVLAVAGWDQGGHEAELKLLATELGIAWTDVMDSPSAVAGQPSVVFLGPQFGDAKTACYANCDSFILPSFSEGLPMVILEAWAYGKPVLMTHECNLPEGFTANAAIQIEPNVESIASKTNQFCSLPESVRLRMGQAGYDLVAEKFNWPNIAHEMMHVYHWLLGSGPKPACVLER